LWDFAGRGAHRLRSSRFIYGDAYGAWAPQEVQLQRAVNTGFPWIPGSHWFARFHERGVHVPALRDPFFHALHAISLDAVIVPAFLWGFLTATTRKNCYIRGIEVGLIGIVAGIVMLRYGILSHVNWHYTVDASLSLFPRRRSQIADRAACACYSHGLLLLNARPEIPKARRWEDCPDK